jgi:hypothetical protein
LELNNDDVLELWLLFLPSLFLNGAGIKPFCFSLMASSPAGMAQTMLNTVVLVFTLVAGLVMFLRLFTRGLLLHKAGAEDAWISLAMVIAHVH